MRIILDSDWSSIPLDFDELSILSKYAKANVNCLDVIVVPMDPDVKPYQISIKAKSNKFFFSFLNYLHFCKLLSG